MTIKKNGDNWLVDLYPEGKHGPRVRKKFMTKGEATRYEAHLLAQVSQGKPWNPKAADSRRFGELVELWFKQHGSTLKDGQRRKNKLDLVTTALSNPLGRALTPEKFLNYRHKRLQEGITAKTCNNELGYLNAVYNELQRTKIIEYQNPLEPVRPIKIAERELSWLTSEQMQELLDSIDSGCENPHVQWITRICLSTGCRWGEAEGLTVRQLRNGSANFTDTKSGRNRSVPIEKELLEQTKAHLQTHGTFSSSITAFRRALDRCSFELPKGQASHVLRHSFASHFMMNGGNILTLQKILGHASITMTMRYSHLAPEHLQAAIELNPLSTLCRHYEEVSKT